MTYRDFQTALCADTDYADPRVRLSRPGWRKLAIESAVLEWYDPPANPVGLRDFREIMRERVKVRLGERFRLESRRRGYGMGPITLVIALAALSALVNFAVSRLLSWWFEDRMNRGPLLWKFRGDLEHNA